MKTRFAIAFLSVLLSIVFSCKKENVTPPTGVYGNISSFMNSKRTPQQVFTIHTSSGGTITGAKGTKVTFPSNCFVHSNGSPVTGDVQIQLEEMFSPADMIFNVAFPINDGSNVLNSGGEYYINISQGGEKLLIAPGQHYHVDLPSQAESPDMQFFNGHRINDSINWIPFIPPIDTGGDSAFYTAFAFQSADSTYSIDCDSTNWCNIDGFATISYFDCTFNLTGIEGLDHTNTTAYAVFDNENTVWPIGMSGWGSIEDNTIEETHLGSVDMHILVISVVDGFLYSGVLAINPLPMTVYTVNMSATTSDALDDLILSLP